MIHIHKFDRNEKAVYQLTLVLIYSRMASGNESHCLWYCSVMEASLLVRWFLSCKPAAVLATELHETFANTSDNAFKNSAIFVAAACSKNCFAACNSFWSKFDKCKNNKNNVNKMHNVKHLWQQQQKCLQLEKRKLHANSVRFTRLYAKLVRN